MDTRTLAKWFGKNPGEIKVSDCYLIVELGYEIDVNDGRISAIKKRGKKNG